MVKARDIVIDSLVDALESLVKQKEELDKNVTGVEAALAYYRSQRATNGHSRTSPNLVDTIYGVLSQHGEAMHRTELYEILIAQGTTIAGERPVGNMTAHMSHDGRFESVGEGKWGLTEWGQDEPGWVTHALEDVAEERGLAW